MSSFTTLNTLSVGTDYEALAARFRPIFARIAEGAVERERSRTLPFEPIQWLKHAGFGAVRVPVEFGGAGASLPQLFQLLIELAAADSKRDTSPARAFCVCRRPPQRSGIQRPERLVRAVCGRGTGRQCLDRSRRREDRPGDYPHQPPGRAMGRQRHQVLQHR